RRKVRLVLCPWNGLQDADGDLRLRARRQRPRRRAAEQADEFPSPHGPSPSRRTKLYHIGGSCCASQQIGPLYFRNGSMNGPRSIIGGESAPPQGTDISGDDRLVRVVPIAGVRP